MNAQYLEFWGQPIRDDPSGMTSTVITLPNQKKTKLAKPIKHERDGRKDQWQETPVDI